MKKFLVIPGIFAVLGLTYIATWFVELNKEQIVVRLGQTHSTEPMAVGFVVLTSIAFGMLACGFLCGIEILALMIQNRRLKRKVASLSVAPKAPRKVDAQAADVDVIAPKTSGRFT